MTLSSYHHQSTFQMPLEKMQKNMLDAIFDSFGEFLQVQDESLTVNIAMTTVTMRNRVMNIVRLQVVTPFFQRIGGWYYGYMSLRKLTHVRKEFCRPYVKCGGLRAKSLRTKSCRLFSIRIWSCWLWFDHVDKKRERATLSSALSKKNSKKISGSRSW